MLTDERISELFNEWFRREKGGDTYADCWNACARAIEAEVLQAQEPATSEIISSTLAAITFYGSQKWAEGKGVISDPSLLNVRQAWDEVYAAIQKLATPQPPAPCQKCAQHEIDFALEHDDKVALQAKVADQAAKEFDWAKANAKCTDTIAQQAERIAGLEKERVSVAGRRVDERRDANKAIGDLRDQLASQAALIEKQSSALAKAQDALRMVGQSLAWLAFGECRSYGEDVPLLKPHEADVLCQAALAVIDVLGQAGEEGAPRHE